MSTRRLAASSRKDLEALRHQGIAATDGYAQIRSIAASVSPEHALLFAEPVHDVSDGTTDWYTSAEGDIRPFGDLSPEEREWTRSRVAELAGGINALAEQLKNSNEGPKVFRGNVLGLALHFPDASHIYLVGPQPVVTCWGFVPAHAGAAPEDMIRAGTLRLAPTRAAETEPKPEVVVAAATVGFAWWRVLLYILLGLLLLAGLLFAAFLLFGPSGCAPEYMQKYAPGCAAKKPDAESVQVPPEILAALNDDRKKEDGLRRELEQLRSKLIERAALCVRETPQPVIEQPKPEPVVETPSVVEPPIEEPPMMADLLPSTPEPPKEEPKPELKPEPKPMPEPKPTPKPRKGEEMVIPEDAKKNNDLSFLEGCWTSEAGMRDTLHDEPIVVRYCFDKNGRGTRDITMGGGSRCAGPVRARFDSSGKLLLKADKAPCNTDLRFRAEQVECTRGAGNKADCYGQSLGTDRTRWASPFRRSE